MDNELATDGATAVQDASVGIEASPNPTLPEPSASDTLDADTTPNIEPDTDDQDNVSEPDQDKDDDDASKKLEEEARLKAEEEQRRVEALAAQKQQPKAKDANGKDIEQNNPAQEHVPPPPPPPPQQGTPVKPPKPKKPKKPKASRPSSPAPKPPSAAIGAAKSTAVVGMLDSIKGNEYLKGKIDISDMEARLRRTDQNLDGLDASESLKAGVLHQDFQDHINGVEAKLNADKPFSEQLQTRNAMRETSTSIARNMHNTTSTLDKFTEFSQDPYAMKVSPDQNSALFNSLKDTPTGARQYAFSQMRREIDNNPDFRFDDAVGSIQKSLGEFDGAYQAINPDAKSTLNQFNNELDANLPAPANTNNPAPLAVNSSLNPPKPSPNRPKVEFGDTYTDSLYEGLERDYDALKADFDNPNANLDELRDNTTRFFDNSKLVSERVSRLSQKGFGDEARQMKLSDGVDGLTNLQADIADKALGRGLLDDGGSQVSSKITESAKSLEHTIGNISHNMGNAVNDIGRTISGFLSR